MSPRRRFIDLSIYLENDVLSDRDYRGEVLMKKTTMKIGIINIMPKTATYHDELLSALDVVSDQVEYFWIRLQTKSYAEEDLLFMADRYQDYSSIKESVQLDAIIVTGAPVELLDFSAVNYWPE